MKRLYIFAGLCAISCLSAAALCLGSQEHVTQVNAAATRYSLTVNVTNGSFSGTTSLGNNITFSSDYRHYVWNTKPFKSIVNIKAYFTPLDVDGTEYAYVYFGTSSHPSGTSDLKASGETVKAPSGSTYFTVASTYYSDLVTITKIVVTYDC